MHLIKTILVAITLLLITHTHAAERERLMRSTFTIADTPENLLSNNLGLSTTTGVAARIEIWQSPYYIKLNSYHDARITLIGKRSAVEDMTGKLDDQIKDAWDNNDLNILFDALWCCCLCRRKSRKIETTLYFPSEEAFKKQLSRFE